MENNVWDYFDKCDGEPDERKAKCHICGNIYCYASTINNLKNHLLRRHDISVGIKILETDPVKTMSNSRKRRNTSAMWAHYTKIKGNDRVASCNYCNSELSYRSTTGNLRSHLKKKHNYIYENSKLENGEKITEELYECNDDGIADQESVESPKGDIWNYYEKETGGRARCAICRAGVAANATSLHKHLKERHPKIGVEQDSDNPDDTNDANETYTEVIYLEESPQKMEYRKPKRKIIDSYPPPQKKFHKFDFKGEKMKKDPQEEELETFGTYITCLLKSLPREKCTLVQRDIINTIMNAKFNESNIMSPSLYVNSPVIFKAVPQEQIVVQNNDVETKSLNTQDLVQNEGLMKGNGVDSSAEVTTESNIC